MISIKTMVSMFTGYILGVIVGNIILHIKKKKNTADDIHVKFCEEYVDRLEKVNNAILKVSEKASLEKNEQLLLELLDLNQTIVDESKTLNKSFFIGNKLINRKFISNLIDKYGYVDSLEMSLTPEIKSAMLRVLELEKQHG